MTRHIAYTLAWVAYGLTRCSEQLFACALQVSEADACDAFHELNGGE